MKFFGLLFIILTVSAFAHDDAFSTRLNAKLALAGTRCEGGEMTVGHHQGEWADYRCPSGEWLIYIDDVNTCSDQGCTEVGVIPIIAKLSPALNNTDPDYTYFTIVPTIPVNSNIRWILRRHWLRFNYQGEGEVIKRY